MSTQQTLVLSRQDVESLLTCEAANERVEYVFREWGRGNVVMPAKINLDMSRSGYDSWANAMPAFVVPTKAAGGNGHDGECGSLGQDVKGAMEEKNVVSENAAAGTGSEPIPAVSGVHVGERRPREGISFTKDDRGGQI